MVAIKEPCGHCGREVVGVGEACPRCGSISECSDRPDAERKLGEIIALCKRYNHSGVNPGAHALANKVIAIAEGGK